MTQQFDNLYYDFMGHNSYDIVILCNAQNTMIQNSFSGYGKTLATYTSWGGSELNDSGGEDSVQLFSNN